MTGAARFRALMAVLIAPLAFSASLAHVTRAAADDADTAEQRSMAAAVDRIAPAVVSIETIGGLEAVGETLFGTGPTTGLVVDPAGYIVSSAFNFMNKPTSILVRLPDGSRKPAKLIATDHARMLVLLKIETEKPLATGQIAPQAEMRVGQWAIAVGRAFDSDRPSRTVGILSALDRIWGKALQTDAAVSPNNYGGPLVDIRGRVLGVLVPLSPEASDELAGAEWYDSGIGFAIAAEHIQRVLPRLKKGEDLRPGLAGFSIKATNVYTDPPIIAACRSNSPAATAGIKASDRIVAVDGRKIDRAAELKQEIGRRYAGDKMHLTLARGKDRVECDLVLAAKLAPFQHGFLGILPMRTGETDDNAAGVAVRYVYPQSPAAGAGIAPGDVIVSWQGEPVDDRQGLALLAGATEPGTSAEIEVRRGKEVRKLKVSLATLPEGLPPAQLPPSREPSKSRAPKGLRVGAMPLKMPEISSEVQCYVPERYDPDASYGIVVWLHAPGGFNWKETLERWKPLCDRHDLILVSPKSSDPARWMPAEGALVDRLLAEIARTYSVDPARIVLYGQESGGTLAFACAFRNRTAIRAVAAVEAVPAGQPPENDPLHRLAIYMASASKSRIARSVDQAVAALRKAKTPLVRKDLGETPRRLTADELAELARWIDTLDRL